MGVVLSKGESVYYDRNYGRGRRRSTGNITITDRRLIRTVESKTGMSKTEIDINDIGGLKMRFKPVMVLAFIAAAVSAAVSGVLGILMNMKKTEAGLGMSDIASGVSVNNYFMLVIILFLAVSAVTFIIGLITLRSGLYIIVKRSVAGNVDFISASESLGKIKPLGIKPRRSEVLELFDSMSTALMQVKALKRKD